MASSDDTRLDDEMQTPEGAGTEPNVDDDEAPVIHPFLFNIHESDRSGLRRRDASHRRPHIPMLRVVQPEDDEEDMAMRDQGEDETVVETDEDIAESSGAEIGHFADEDEWESSEVAALAPHLVEHPRIAERAEVAASEVVAERPATDDTSQPAAPVMVSVIEWAGGDMRAWRSQAPAPFHADVQQRNSASAAETAMEEGPIVETRGDAAPQAPVVEATDSEAAVGGPLAKLPEGCEAQPPSDNVDSEMCDAAAAHAAAVELAATAEATAIHGLEARATQEARAMGEVETVEIRDETEAAGSLEASPFWSEDDDLSVAAAAEAPASASALADDDVNDRPEAFESLEEPRPAARADAEDDDDNVKTKAPQRVGSGRRIRRNFEWRPGDLFGDGPEPGRHKFNWWQVWRTAAVTAACGVIAVLLVAR